MHKLNLPYDQMLPSHNQWNSNQNKDSQMDSLLIVGGSSGIGHAILQTQASKRSCINVSRTKPEVTDHFDHYELDVLTDDLPDLEGLNTIIYCPGTINLKPVGSLKEEDFIHDFRVNLLGAVRVVNKYSRQLKKSLNASIILFSTVAVDQGMAFHASVAAAKGAVEGFAKSLAAEFAPSIRVNVIAPTITNTPLASRILRNEEMIKKMQDRHPLKRIIDPSEIAGLVNYLISPEAASISGQVFKIDAGITSIR